MTDGCECFVAICSELFRLEQRYGYQAEDAFRDTTECSIMFRKGDRAILMLVDHAEHFGRPTIQIRPPDPNERFGLHEALPAMSVACPDYGFRLSTADLRDVLEHYATFFHRHSHQLLDDHTTIFAAVKKQRAGSS